MRRRSLTILSAILIASCATISTPQQSQAQQQPFVYPAQGQTPEQLAQDEFECFQWARDRTGFDPTQPGAGAQSESGGSVAGSAAVGAGAGAVGGALVGSLFGRPGRGAAIGAASGGLFGGARQSGRQQQDQRAQQAAQQQHAVATDEYFRGFGTCMTGRGYTVS